MAEYIDREALEAKLNERYDYLLEENGPYDHFTDGYGEAVCTVEESPAADVVPAVHGRLVREVREVTDAVSVKGWACSVCGGFVKNQPVDRWRYCPFCGAPFDGGDLDGQKV